MKSMSGKELAKLLEANGWNLLRVQGSHHIYGKTGNTSRISVPIHRNQDLKIGLLRNLLKTAELLDFVEGKTIELEPESEDRIDVDLPVDIDINEPNQ
jgi:predicted RNA binding protein YcfA (HicA-like mRNA interferase family)